MAMRTRKSFLIAVFAGMWTFVTICLLLRQNNDVDQRRTHLLQKLNYLESSIRDESKTHDALVKDLVHILKIHNEILATSAEPTKIIQPEIEVPPALPPVLINEPVMLDPNIAANNKLVREIPLEGSQNQNNEVYVAPIANSPLQKLAAKKDSVNGPIIPVIVFACNRVSVNKCLDNLIEYRTNPDQFPIIVSQDCDDEATRNVILNYKDEVTLIQQPDQSDILVMPKEKKFKGYYKIARHYGWALNETFRHGFDYAIIVEDDLNVAQDFYEYFLGTYPLLKNDSTLWCVSAWNDNGKDDLIDENSPDLLYRTDFFPGLGWMLTKELWSELSVKWPKAFWDDWIRNPAQRKERACIRPEVSRTRTFGKIGVSNGLFFDKHLRYIKLSSANVEFSKKDLSFLLKQNYDKTFIKKVYETDVVTYEELRRGMVKTKGPVRIQYNTKDQYKRTAKMLGLMDDFKSGVPRTGYQGIVSFFHKGQRVYLAPNTNWRGYDLSWS